MSYIDIALLVMMIFGAISGYKEGFLMELMSLIAILLGILIGFKLMGLAMIFLDQKFNIDESVLPYVSFGAIFLIVVILVTLMGRAIKATIDKSFLGRADQASGALLGLFKTAFMLSVILWIVHSLNVAIPDKWIKDAWLYPRISSLAPQVTDWISEYIPVFDDVF